MCNCMQPHHSILPKPPCPVHDYERVFPVPLPVLPMFYRPTPLGVMVGSCL